MALFAAYTAATAVVAAPFPHAGEVAGLLVTAIVVLTWHFPNKL